ncbi:hypothetical protein C4553_03110 [Candidatus Parcubacteria bacterium]|nr:MAG: hypothetical protein C4553_03110 [Candidatus Parcubacteria bacterium]
MNIINGGKITWVDIHNPTDKDIEYLKTNYNFHPLILTELTKSTLRPKVDTYDDHFYMVLHFPIFSQQELTTLPYEFDFIITKDALITAHFTKIDLFDDFFNTLKNNEPLQKKYLQQPNPGYLLNHLITIFFNFALRELDHIKINLDKIENRIFKDHSKNNLVEQISVVRRDIINFRRIILPQRTTLESLVDAAAQYFGKESAHYFSGLLGRYLLVWNNLENHKEAAEAIQATNESLITTRTNQIIKTLTIITTILLPLNMISQVFFVQLNSPFLESEMSFWIGIIAMTAIAASLLVIFKKRDWL